MKEREYLHLKAQAEAEYRKKIEALDLVWKMSGGNKTGSNGASSAHAGKGDLARRVKDAINSGKNEFTVFDILNVLVQNDPNVKKTSVATVLRRLQGKDIDVVKPGVGRAPSVFRKKNKSAQDDPLAGL